MADTSINIPIKTTVDAKELGLLEGSLASLKRELGNAKKAFEAAAPGSAAWSDAARRVADLNVRIIDGLRPLRDVVEANLRADATQRQLNAAIASGVNPWTMASAKYREAQAALQAQTAAARDAAQASAALARAKAAETQVSRGDAVMAAQRQMAQDMREAEHATQRLHTAVAKLPEANDKVGKSSSQAAQGVLEVSRAFEDAQYGIAGVLNNIPNIIMRFGGGAGLAGVLSMAAVAASFLAKRLDGANFDDTWIGDVKESLSEMITGMSKAEAEAKKIIEAPDSWRKTGAEAAAEYQTAVEKALTREIELLRQRNDLMKAADDMRMKEQQHAEKMLRLNNPNRASKGTEEWAQKETEIIDSKYREGHAGRVNRMDKAYHDGTSAEDEASKAAAELKKAEATKAGLIRREDLLRQEAILKGSQAEDEKMLGHLAFSESQGGTLSEEAKAQKAEIEKRIAQRNSLGKAGNTLGGVQAELAKLPGPREGEDLPAAHARAAADVEARQAEATHAADAAKKASQVRKDTAKEVRMEEEEATAQRKLDMKGVAEVVNRTAFDDARKNQKEAKAEAEKKAKEEEERRKLFQAGSQGEVGPPAPDFRPVTKADIAATNAGLVQMNNAGIGARAAGLNPEANADFRTGVGTLRNALNDGKGDQSAEMAVITEMRDKIASGQATRAEALQAALKAMADLQTDGGQMEQRLVATLSAMAQSQRALRSQLDALTAQLENDRAGRHQ